MAALQESLAVVCHLGLYFTAQRLCLDLPHLYDCYFGKEAGEMVLGVWESDPELKSETLPNINTRMDTNWSGCQ